MKKDGKYVYIIEECNGELSLYRCGEKEAAVLQNMDRHLGDGSFIVYGKNELNKAVEELVRLARESDDIVSVDVQETIYMEGIEDERKEMCMDS